MYFKDVGYLMKETETLDALHRPRVSYEKTLVYCNIKSVGQSEFYQASSVGYKPELKIECKLVDLTDVTHFEYNDRVYKILRTYKKEDITEITLTALVDTNE
jgi:hypothetical protein